MSINKRNSTVALPPRVALLLLLASDHFDPHSTDQGSHTEAVAAGVFEDGCKWEVAIEPESRQIILVRTTNVLNDGVKSEVDKFLFPCPLPPQSVRFDSHAEF